MTLIFSEDVSPRAVFEVENAVDVQYRADCRKADRSLSYKFEGYADCTAESPVVEALGHAPKRFLGRISREGGLIEQILKLGSGAKVVSVAQCFDENLTVRAQTRIFSI